MGKREGATHGSCPLLFLRQAESSRHGQGGGEMSKSMVDRKEEEKIKNKRGRPKKGSKNESAKDAGGTTKNAQVNGGAESGEAKEEKEKRENGKKANEAEGEEKKGKARKVLRKAVKKAVKSMSSDIATALVNEMIGGNKYSTELVMSFVDKKTKGEGGSSRNDGLTADDLPGSEENWESESWVQAEGKAEVGMGGREPEGS